MIQFSKLAHNEQILSSWCNKATRNVYFEWGLDPQNLNLRAINQESGTQHCRLFGDFYE